MLKNIFKFCFYSSFLTIILTCLLETLTYPGILLNKTGISLFNFISIIGLISLFSYFLSNLFGLILQRPRRLFILSLFIILITLVLTLVESLTYPNFVFSKFHINYKALQTLSSFLIIFLSLFLILKINFKKIFQGKSKLLIIIILFLIPILSYFSWNQYLSANNIVKSETRLSNSSKNSFAFLKDESKKNSLKNQFTWFFKPNNSYGQIKIIFNLITISFSTLFLIIAILFYLNWKQNKCYSRIGTALLFFYLGGIAYIFLIIGICITMFSVGELKTFQGRYILTYALALIMFSFYLFLKNLQKQKITITSLLYLILLFLTINISNLVKLKPANKEIFQNREKQELMYQKVKDNFKNGDKPIFHTIGGEGAVNYRYYLAPYSVVTPIWQGWDVFMLENPGFKMANYVFLTSASDVNQKWSDSQIEKIFKDKKNVKDNGLYKIIYTSEDKSSFQLELINSYNL